MRRKNIYMLHEAGGKSLLIPAGQALADDNRPLVLNESGLFLWKELEKEITKEELLRRLAEEYAHVPWNTLNMDVEEFLDGLREKNILEER